MRTTGNNSLVIFGDGSSLGNPGPGAWGAILIYEKLDEIIELGGTKIQTTNNEMELTAIISALSYAINSTAPIEIYTDSQYVLNGIQSWVHTWVRNGWKTSGKEDVKNKELWQTLHQLVESRDPKSISWNYVPGHRGIPANERVDDIARGLAEGKNISLYRGKLSAYPIPYILQIPKNTKQKKESHQKSSVAYVYLALFEKRVYRFDTWAECETFVKGRSAKFRKALSPEHEQEILQEWGITNENS